jgi:hypothetical protein
MDQAKSVVIGFVLFALLTLTAWLAWSRSQPAELAAGPEGCGELEF